MAGAWPAWSADIVLDDDGTRAHKGHTDATTRPVTRPSFSAFLFVWCWVTLRAPPLLRTLRAHRLTVCGRPQHATLLTAGGLDWSPRAADAYLRIGKSGANHCATNVQPRRSGSAMLRQWQAIKRRTPVQLDELLHDGAMRREAHQELFWKGILHRPASASIAARVLDVKVFVAAVSFDTRGNRESGGGGVRRVDWFCWAGQFSPGRECERELENCRAEQSRMSRSRAEQNSSSSNRTAADWKSGAPARRNLGSIQLLPTPIGTHLCTPVHCPLSSAVPSLGLGPRGGQGQVGWWTGAGAEWWVTLEDTASSIPASTRALKKRANQPPVDITRPFLHQGFELKFETVRRRKDIDRLAPSLPAPSSASSSLLAGTARVG
ncbi:hypothetical protein CMUS01_11154 [Colletotrichum musicola]|uniref:Uncharacterized protein n=1 Tax=Colletotrichum musicola TaxID=2175873 RepID=A0A8H6N7F7_9PEZI|nr:hypothetical protein CMUS01_11154 [Colletotrichum musicola]